MEVNKFILYKGEKIPMVNTPLTREEIWSLKDNYDRFIINDVHRRTNKFYSGEPLNKKYSIDISFKHVFYAVASLYTVFRISFGFYHILLAKHVFLNLGHYLDLL